MKVVEPITIIQPTKYNRKEQEKKLKRKENKYISFKDVLNNCINGGK